MDFLLDLGLEKEKVGLPLLDFEALPLGLKEKWAPPLAERDGAPG